jgi:hypothetical protein
MLSQERRGGSDMPVLAPRLAAPMPEVRRARLQLNSYAGCAVPTPIIWGEITTVFKGRVVRGSYAVEDGTVKVRADHGEKATQLRGTNAIWAAGRLLRELAAEGKA